MRAVVLEERLQFRQDWPLPQLMPGEAVIAPSLVGVCKTDLELVKGYMGFRGVLGHEFVGTVVECEDPSWIGKRVVGEINCSPADLPVSDPRHQDGRSVLGILGRDGVMAERFLLPITNLLPVPEGTPDHIAVFTEPLAAAYEIEEQMGQLPDRALVLGDGKLGALCALALADRGCAVTLLGKHPQKLAKIPHSVQTVALDQADSLPNDFPLVVEATGSPSGLPEAIRRVRPKGTIILKTTVAAPHNLDLSPIVINEIALLGSRCGRFAPALEALATGRIDPSFLIQETLPLERACEAFALAETPGAGKILLQI